jgi:hypothetical protein
MRREGTVSLQIIVQYMIGTLAGILAAALIVRLVPVLPVITLIAVACAASSRARAQPDARVHGLHCLLYACY